MFIPFYTYVNKYALPPEGISLVIDLNIQCAVDFSYDLKLLIASLPITKNSFILIETVT